MRNLISWIAFVIFLGSFSQAGTGEDWFRRRARFYATRSPSPKLYQMAEEVLTTLQRLPGFNFEKEKARFNEAAEYAKDKRSWLLYDVVSETFSDTVLKNIFCRQKCTLTRYSGAPVYIPLDVRGLSFGAFCSSETRTPLNSININYNILVGLPAVRF